MPSDATIYVIIAITLVGFIALAFVLLFPVYRFMKRQEEIADDWTPEALARYRRGDGDDAPPPEASPPA